MNGRFVCRFPDINLHEFVCCENLLSVAPVTSCSSLSMSCSCKQHVSLSRESRRPRLGSVPTEHRLHGSHTNLLRSPPSELLPDQPASMQMTTSCDNLWPHHQHQPSDSEQRTELIQSRCSLQPLHRPAASSIHCVSSGWGGASPVTTCRGGCTGLYMTSSCHSFPALTLLPQTTILPLHSVSVIHPNKPHFTLSPARSSADLAVAEPRVDSGDHRGNKTTWQCLRYLRLHPFYYIFQLSLSTQAL